MSQAERDARRKLDWSVQLNLTGWYHSFELPDGRRTEGVQSLEYEKKRWARFPIPADLTGKRVIDIGAWDGWFSFEAERRGAAVTSVDCVEMENYLAVRRLLGSRTEYVIADVFDLPSLELLAFDYVFFLGILYHLRHPLLALEIVCRLTKDVAIVESLVTDAADWESHGERIPTLEFYETDELGGHLDNWFAPTVAALQGMCRAAGFARTELLYVGDDQAQVACYRRWPEVAEGFTEAAPELLPVFHARNGGINFTSRREDYLVAPFRTSRGGVRREDLQLQVGEFGAHVLYVKPAGEGVWEANAQVPPGLAPGWHEVRVRTTESAWSDPVRVAVDVRAESRGLEITGVADGVRWTAGRVGSGHAAVWVRGLPENADRNSLQLWIDGERLRVTYVGEGGEDGVRQVNAALPVGLGGGEYRLSASLGNTRSADIALTVELD